MSTLLRQSTAIDIGLGPFVDAADGFTAETALTISQADVRLKKNGANWAQKNNASSCTHEENGWYECALSTADTDTLGELLIAVHETGARPISRVFQVVPANVYDSMVANSGVLAVNTTQLAGVAYSAQRDALIDLVWDELLTGATHNTAASAGRRLRELASGVVTSGTAQSGTINTIMLANTASSVDGTYDPSLIWIVNGTGAGQARLILQYFGATRLAYVDRDWRTAPDATSEYQIIASTNPMSTNEGLAQGATASTITLNALASPVDDIYTGQQVVVRTGTGQDQSRLIAAYNGATRVATVAQPWTVIPTATSAYIMFPTGRTMVTQIGDEAQGELVAAVWDEALAAHLTGGSTGAALSSASSAAGSGVIAFTYTVTNSVDGLPIDGVSVWVTTDSSGLNIVARGVTDAFGRVVVYLDPGTYYFWQALAGYDFSNPSAQDVS